MEKAKTMQPSTIDRVASLTCSPISAAIIWIGSFAAVFAVLFALDWRLRLILIICLVVLEVARVLGAIYMQVNGLPWF